MAALLSSPNLFLCSWSKPLIHTNIQTNTVVVSFCFWRTGSPGLPGDPPCLCSCSCSAAQHLFLSRGNELLSGGRVHNGTSHNATFTGPHTGLGEQSANQTLSGPSPRRQSSIVVQEEDRGNNNQSPGLSDFSSCLLLLLAIQSGLSASTSSLRTPMRKLLERQAKKKEDEWR